MKEWTSEKVLRSQLEHIVLRPKMWVGDTPTTSIELAAFMNGYMAHRSGFMRSGFGMSCQADPNQTPEENGKRFLDQILTWDKNKSGLWLCCVDAPVGER